MLLDAIRNNLAKRLEKAGEEDVALSLLMGEKVPRNRIAWEAFQAACDDEVGLALPREWRDEVAAPAIFL